MIRLFLTMKNLVYYIVNTRYKHNVDLYDVGLIGLIKGVKSFDPSKGYALSTYLTKCINNEILMTFKKRKKDTLDVNYKSLDEPWDNNVMLGDVVPDKNVDILSDVIKQEQIDKLYKLIDELTERDQFIICSLYGLKQHKKLTQKSIT